MSMMITSPCATKRRDALVERLFESAIGMLDVMSVYVGDRLGLYQVLAERGSLTAKQLAQATGTNERYIREWLEQQASTGILEAEDDAAPHLRGNAETRRFSLPAGHAEVLIDRDSLNCLAGLLRLIVGVGKPLPALLEAYKTGAGVPYPEFGVDTREGIAEMNRPMFLNLLGQEWLPAIPELARPAPGGSAGPGAGRRLRDRLVQHRHRPSLPERHRPRLRRRRGVDRLSPRQRGGGRPRGPRDVRHPRRLPPRHRRSLRPGDGLRDGPRHGSAGGGARVDARAAGRRRAGAGGRRAGRRRRSAPRATRSSGSTTASARSTACRRPSPSPTRRPPAR